MINSEKQTILAHLQASTLAMLAMLEDTSEEAFLEKANPDRWSIAEIVEHVMLVETGVLMNLQKLGKEASREITFDNPPTADEVVTKSVNREITVAAPAIFTPKGNFKNKANSVAAFMAHRKKIEHFLQTTAIPLKAIAFPHPRLGLFNGENWLAFMAGHCLRHLEQIRLIKEKS